MDVAAHELLTARASWRRLRLGEHNIDMIPRYAASDGSPLQECAVGDPVGDDHHLVIRGCADDLFFPAIYECTDDRLLVGWSRLLQGTLRAGDRLWVRGCGAEATYRGEQRTAVVVTESDRLDRLLSEEGHL